MIKGQVRGHIIFWNGKGWRYLDTGEALNLERPCKRCLRLPTNEQDACIANTPNIESACCGHGIAEPYFIKIALPAAAGNASIGTAGSPSPAQGP